MSSYSKGTDIHVVLDPEFKHLTQVVQMNPLDELSPVTEHESGKRIPVVLINRKTINPYQVHKVHIDFTDTYPEGYVEISDPEGLTYKYDQPGANNRILITIVPDSDKYRKIKIPGYITDAYQYQNYVHYNFKYKYMPLEKAYVKAWPRCNTYNLFKKIASDTGLGFAVGEEVENIEDIHYRCCTGLVLKDFLTEQISIAGLDMNSVMDYWIDPWGYINIVNIPHQIEKIDENVKLSVTIGNTAEIADISGIIKKDVELPRLITNLDLGVRTNISILDYKPITDNYKISSGNSFTDYIFNPQGINNQDEANVFEVKTSVPGRTPDALNINEYAFSGIRYLGAEMDELPILQQKICRDNYIKSLSTSHMEFTLERPNFGLTRGLQLPVLINSYGISKFIRPDTNITDTLDNDSAPVVDEFLSGVYYIAGMSFTYTRNSDCLLQKLQCIKLDHKISPSALLKSIDGSISLDSTASTLLVTSMDSKGELN